MNYEIRKKTIKMINEKIRKSIFKIAKILAIIIFFLALMNVGGTNSSFSSSETSLNNSFTAGEWDLEEPDDPEEILPEEPEDVITDVSTPVGTDVITSSGEAEETLPPVD